MGESAERFEPTEANLTKVSLFRKSLGLPPTSFTALQDSSVSAEDITRQGYKQALRELYLTRESGHTRLEKLEPCFTIMSMNIDALLDEFSHMTDEERLNSFYVLSPPRKHTYTKPDSEQLYQYLSKLGDSVGMSEGVWWSRFYRSVHTSLVLKKEGKVDIALLSTFLSQQSDEYRWFSFPDKLLTEEEINEAPVAERRKLRFWNACSSNFKSFIPDAWDEVYDKYVDEEGYPTLAFCERWIVYGGMPRSDFFAKNLGPEFFSKFPPRERAFWSFWSQQPRGMQYVLLLKNDYYSVINASNTIDIKQLADLILSRITTRTVDQWKILPWYLEAIRALPMSLARTKSYIALTEIIKNFRLGFRTESEEIAIVQAALGEGVQADIPPEERRAWYLLRSSIPTGSYTTENVMRKTAEEIDVIHDERRELVSWARQNEHNYLHPLAPHILERFCNWLDTGDEMLLQQVKQMVSENIPGVSFPEALFTDTARDDLNAWKGSELHTLASQVRAFFTVDTQGFRKSVNMLYGIVPNTVRTLLRAAATDFQHARGETAESFLLNAHHARQTLAPLLVKHLAGKKIDTLSPHHNLLLVDMQLSHMYDIALASYTHEHFLPRLKNNELSEYDLQTGFQLFANTLSIAHLEGELERNHLGALHQAISRGDYSQIYRALVRLKRDSDQAQRDFFIEASSPVITVLKNSGMSDGDARKKAIHGDLVEMRKLSQLFKLEPLSIALQQALLKKLPLGTPPIYEEDIDLIQRHEENAGKYCRWLFKDMVDSSTGKLKPYTKKIDEYEINFLPDAFDRVKVIVNGQQVDNPEEYIRKHFHPVVAMQHALREGD